MKALRTDQPTDITSCTKQSEFHFSALLLQPGQSPWGFTRYGGSRVSQGITGYTRGYSVTHFVFTRSQLLAGLAFWFESWLISSFLSTDKWDNKRRNMAASSWQWTISIQIVRFIWGWVRFFLFHLKWFSIYHPITWAPHSKGNLEVLTLELLTQTEIILTKGWFGTETISSCILPINWLWLCDWREEHSVPSTHSVKVRHDCTQTTVKDYGGVFSFSSYPCRESFTRRILSLSIPSYLRLFPWISLMAINMFVWSH